VQVRGFIQEFGRSRLPLALAVMLAGCPEIDPGAPDASDAVDAGVIEEATTWPNALGPENGSPWLRANHDRLTAIHPRVLVLDVRKRDGFTELGTLVDGLVAAFAAQSTHRGTLDPAATPFVNYTIDKVIDLRDANGADYPDFWPPQTPQGFDVGELFDPAFAPRLGYADPDAPGGFLTMCDLFERGLVNELWISAEAGVRNVYENQSRLQVYDDALEPIEGRFDGCTNGCFFDPGNRVNCSVSVRLQEINVTRGVGCGTHAAGHALEHLRFVNPYLAANMTRFLGFDLDTRHGLPLDSLYECPYREGLCVDFPEPGRIESSDEWEGAGFSADWGDACGNVHFPPNARGQYDYYSDVEALASCDGYGRGEGDGGDARRAYSQADWRDLDALHGDCGGGWVVYWGQSMPGLGNAATAADGTPMKNWWPFLFY